MKIIPILTEKSLNMARAGKYSFWVDPGLNKNQNSSGDRYCSLEVHVVGIPPPFTKNRQVGICEARNVTEAARKKAIVKLAKDEKNQPSLRLRRTRKSEQIKVVIILKKSGRSNSGKVTVRHQVAGRRDIFREIDWRRSKKRYLG